MELSLFLFQYGWTNTGRADSGMDYHTTLEFNSTHFQYADLQFYTDTRQDSITTTEDEPFDTKPSP